MPDERYAWGTTLAAFNRSVPGIVESTLAASIDSAFTPYSILIPINVDFIRTMPFVDAVSTLDLWCHFEIYPGTSNVITSVAVF